MFDKVTTHHRPIYVCAQNIEAARKLIQDNGLKLSECKIIPGRQPYKREALIGVTAHKEQFLGDFTEKEIHLCWLSLEAPCSSTDGE